MPLYLIVVIGVVFLLLYWQLRGTFTIPKRWQNDGPACGNCAYSYTGQPVCPECGYAITHVGIVTPRLLIIFGPGPRLALGCLLVMGIISVAGMFAVGHAIEDAVLPPGARSGSASSLSQTAELYEISFMDLRSTGTPGRDANARLGSTAPFGLTVVEQAVYESGRSPPSRTIVGEIVMVIRPAGTKPYIPSPSQSVFTFVPALPHLRIDIVKKSVRVFDANSKLIAEYPTIDPRAFDALSNAATIDRTLEITEEALKAAETVYHTIAASPDTGGTGLG